MDERLKTRLRLQAAHHGHSMEEEARAILRAGLSSEEPAKPSLAESIRRHFASLGGVELAIKPREPMRRPPNFGK